jgi:hypothetical protein
MIGRATPPALALAMCMWMLAGSLGAAGCGGDGGGGEQGVDPGDNSVIVVHLAIDADVPPVYRIEVHAHLGNSGQDATLYFPMNGDYSSAIPADATLALLIPPTIDDMVDLMLYGLVQGVRVASGRNQIQINVRGRAEVGVPLHACNGGC